MKNSKIVFTLIFGCACLAGCGSSSSASKEIDAAQKGSPSSLEDVAKDFVEDKLVSSHRAYDVAIRGPGFYIVQSPTGEIFYTRLGSFIQNAQKGGALTTRHGYLLQAYAIDENGQVDKNLSSVTLATTELLSVWIKRNGIIAGAFGIESGTYSNAVERDLYQLPLATFASQGALRKIYAEDRIYAATESSGPAILGNARTTERGWLKTFAIESRDVALLKALPNMTQGAFLNSERASDLAIQGHGFFIVRDPLDGRLLYSRNGSFQLDSKGCLALADGHVLQAYAVDENENRAAVLSDVNLQSVDYQWMQSFTINSEGQFYAEYYRDQSTQMKFIIPLASFINPEGLKTFEDYERIFVEGSESGPASIGLAGRMGRGEIRSYALELNPSND